MLPKKVKIGPHVYRIKVGLDKDAKKRGLAGKLDWEKQEIQIAKDVAPSCQEEYLVHEILHGIDIHFNDDDLTEKQISHLAKGIYSVLKENKFKL